MKRVDCLAQLYKETEEFENASECYLKMAEVYLSRGFDVESEMMKCLAKEALDNLKAE